MTTADHLRRRAKGYGTGDGSCDTRDLMARAAKLLDETHALLETARAERDAARTERDVALTERDAARTQAADMHRRAQRLEGIELHMVTLRAGYESALAGARHCTRIFKAVMRKRYHDAVAQIVAAGVDDRLDDAPTARSGNLTTMIERLIAERDVARRAYEQAHAERQDGWSREEQLIAICKQVLAELDASRTREEKLARLVNKQMDEKERLQAQLFFETTKGSSS